MYRQRYRERIMHRNVRAHRAVHNIIQYYNTRADSLHPPAPSYRCSWRSHVARAVRPSRPPRKLPRRGTRAMMIFDGGGRGRIVWLSVLRARAHAPHARVFRMILFSLGPGGWIEGVRGGGGAQEDGAILFVFLRITTCTHFSCSGYTFRSICFGTTLIFRLYLEFVHISPPLI